MSKRVASKGGYVTSDTPKIMSLYLKKENNNMNNFLILYDTNEEDLAKDFEDLLEDIGIKNVKLIPLSPNKGKTLEGKEDHYFGSAYGVLFIITPRFTVEGKQHCSNSIAVEVGMAKTIFHNNPERIILLLEEGCEQPTVIQRAYIPFVRGDIRSIIKALTLMIKDLKAAGFINPIPQPEEFDLKTLSEKLSNHAKAAVLHISKQKNMHIKYHDFDDYLKQEFKYDDQKINFLVTDLVDSGIMKWAQFGSGWELTRKGRAVAKFEYETQIEAARNGITNLVTRMGMIPTKAKP